MEQQEATVEEEVLLHFKRFPAEKQDQVRALVNYATLMGLDGKDLVSIGGKLDRVKAKREIICNRNIVSGMGIRPIGRDKDCRNRWAWTDAHGVIYHFDEVNYHRFRVTNTKTKRTARQSYSGWETPNVGSWHYLNNRNLPGIMLSIYNGTIVLP